MDIYPFSLALPGQKDLGIMVSQGKWSWYCWAGFSQYVKIMAQYHNNYFEKTCCLLDCFRNSFIFAPSF